MTIRVTVNGKPTEAEAEETIAALLQRLGAKPGLAAVVVNDKVIPKARHQNYGLTAGDHIEILTFAAGG